MAAALDVITKICDQFANSEQSLQKSQAKDFSAKSTSLSVIKQELQEQISSKTTKPPSQVKKTKAKKPTAKKVTAAP